MSKATMYMEVQEVWKEGKCPPPLKGCLGIVALKNVKFRCEMMRSEA